MKIMNIICEAYAYAFEFIILFNPPKFKLISFNVDVDNLDITLVCEKVVYVSSETYWASVSTVT